MANDPATLAKLLRAIASGSDAKANRQDVILNAAADVLDPPEQNKVKAAELRELADNFEGAGADAIWTGLTVARALRARAEYYGY